MATSPVLVTNASQEVSLQSRHYANAIGSAIQLPVIQDILEFAADAKLPSFYDEEEGMEDIWYEMLDKEGLSEKVGDIADAWVEASKEFSTSQCILLTIRFQNKANIQRAETLVQRQATVSGPAMVKKFGFCRFKATPATESWYYLEEGPGVDSTGQTIVFIALEDLGPHNGFPFVLKHGQDVCIEGKAGIWTPPTGGGRAIFFSLNL